MVKVRSIELHSYDENTLPTSKYKLIVVSYWTLILEPLSVLLPTGPHFLVFIYLTGFSTLFLVAVFVYNSEIFNFKIFMVGPKNRSSLFHIQLAP